MSEARRREILAGERFDPDTDVDLEGGESFVFDPKRRRKRRIYKIPMTFKQFIPIYTKLAKTYIYYQLLSTDVPLKDDSVITMLVFSKMSYDRVKKMMK